MPDEQPALSSPAVPPQAWTACYGGFSSRGDPQADLARLTLNCGPLGGMHPTGQVTLGEQAATDRPDLYAIDVPPGGACYRAFAVGDARIGDLDLLVRDAEQALAGDLSADPWPVLPPHGPLCLPVAGRYLLEVSVSRGAGRYALQLWATR